MNNDIEIFKKVLEGIHDESTFKAGSKDPENPPELPEDVQRMRAVKTIAKKNIIAAAERYLKSRERSELVFIQQLVDELNDAFVLMIYDLSDGIPHSITFNPGKDPSLDSLKETGGNDVGTEEKVEPSKEEDNMEPQDDQNLSAPTAPQEEISERTAVDDLPVEGDQPATEETSAVEESAPEVTGEEEAKPEE